MSVASLAVANDVRQVSDELCCPLCGESTADIWLRTTDRFHLLTKVYELLRCPACSLVWIKDPPQPNAMAAHYGPKYHNAISAVGEEDADPRWQEHVGTVRRFKVSGALLDIGCNSGAFLAAIKNDGWKLSGIEIDPEVADRARSRTGAVVFPGDALSASFPAESFDAVTCFHVLEHQHHPFELMATVWRWLRPGGIFYVVVPNIDSWEARLFRSYWYGLEAPRHLYHFSVDSLRRCGVQAGFQVEELRTRSDCHIEASLQYVVNEVRRRLHRPALAPADAPRPGLASRIMQKAFYITILSPLAHVAAISGNGASISAVFKKTTHRS